jgi:hypothetical protein
MSKTCDRCNCIGGGETENIATDVLKLVKKRFVVVVIILCIIIVTLLGYIVHDAVTDKGDVCNETIDEKVSCERSLTSDEQIRFFACGIPTLFECMPFHGGRTQSVRTSKTRQKRDTNINGIVNV